MPFLFLHPSLLCGLPCFLGFVTFRVEIDPPPSMYIVAAQLTTALFFVSIFPGVAQRGQYMCQW